MHKILKNNPPPCLDLDIIAEAKDILGDRFPQLLNRFITETNGLLSTIEFSRASHDYVTVRDTAHSLKSASYQMGAMQMHHISAQVEAFIHQKKTINTVDDEAMLDSFISALRSSFADYQSDILHHL